jgi:hypothetical protein
LDSDTPNVLSASLLLDTAPATGTVKRTKQGITVSASNVTGNFRRRMPEDGNPNLVTIRLSRIPTN